MRSQSIIFAGQGGSAADEGSAADDGSATRDSSTALLEAWQELTTTALDALEPEGTLDALAASLKRRSGAAVVVIAARDENAVVHFVGEAGISAASRGSAWALGSVNWRGARPPLTELREDHVVWPFPLQSPKADGGDPRRATRPAAAKRRRATAAGGGTDSVDGCLYVVCEPDVHIGDEWLELFARAASIAGRVLGQRARQAAVVGETRQRLATLLDSLQNGVIVEDNRGRVVEANAAYCRLWEIGVEPAALIGQPAASIGRPPLAKLRDPAGAWALFERLKAERVAALEQELRLGDGRTLEIDFVPFRLPKGQAGYLWIYRDVTARRRVEAEVRQLNQELEARVVLRTHELALSNRELESSLRRLNETQAQLIHAGKMAAVGALVAGLSHELNNPLGIIVGYVQGLLRRTPQSSPGRESLVAIERQAQRCAHLVRSLLDFSRNKRDPREEIGIVTLVERVIELAAGHARRRRVEIRWAPPTTLPALIACPQEIESALLNLVSNAIDATPAGGSVTLDAQIVETRGCRGVELAVRDTGSGIPAEVLPHIFDPFFTTKPVGQGTGIGLSITRQLIEGHQGHIDVDTKRGEGTTMRLWLPLGATPAAEKRTEKRAS